MEKKGFFDRLEKATKANGTNELAEILGVEPGTVSNWKNGRNRPSYETIFTLRELKEINLHWLLTGKGEMYLRDTGVMTEKDRHIFKLGTLVYEATQTLKAIEQK